LTATTIRTTLRNPVDAGDLVWSCRCDPKFHRLEGDQIVPLDDVETRHYRRNPKSDWIVSDWIVEEGAHPELIDRATFDAVQAKDQSSSPMPRRHVNEFLLTGPIACSRCGDAETGSTRTQRRIICGVERVFSQMIYLCGGSLRT
jgi:hypothetical protein